MTRFRDRWRRRFASPMTAGARRAFITLLVIAFTIGAANLLFTARQVNDVARADAAAVKAAASTRQLCLAGNEARAEQVTLWNYVVSISRPPPHETPAQERQRLASLRAFEAYLHRVFAPRNCVHPLTAAH